MIKNAFLEIESHTTTKPCPAEELFIQVIDPSNKSYGNINWQCFAYNITQYFKINDITKKIIRIFLTVKSHEMNYLFYNI